MVPGPAEGGKPGGLELGSQKSLGGRGQLVNVPLGLSKKLENIAAQDEDVITSKISVAPFYSVFYDKDGKRVFLNNNVEEKINKFDKKYIEYGGNIKRETKRPGQSEYIDYEKRTGALAKIAADALRPESNWAGLRDRIIFAKKRNKAFEGRQKVAKKKEKQEYGELRRK